MYFKHPLVPAIKIKSDFQLRVSDKARICTECDIEDKHCSEKCKRYKKKLEELKSGGISGDSSGKPDREG